MLMSQGSEFPRKTQPFEMEVDQTKKSCTLIPKALLSYVVLHLFLWCLFCPSQNYS